MTEYRLDKTAEEINNHLNNGCFMRLDYQNAFRVDYPTYPNKYNTEEFIPETDGFISIAAQRTIDGYTIRLKVNDIVVAIMPCFKAPTSFSQSLPLSAGDRVKIITDSEDDTWRITDIFFIPVKE